MIQIYENNIEIKRTISILANKIIQYQLKVSLDFNKVVKTLFINEDYFWNYDNELIDDAKIIVYGYRMNFIKPNYLYLFDKKINYSLINYLRCSNPNVFLMVLNVHSRMNGLFNHHGKQSILEIFNSIKYFLLNGINLLISKEISDAEIMQNFIDVSDNKLKFLIESLNSNKNLFIICGFKQEFEKIYDEVNQLCVLMKSVFYDGHQPITQILMNISQNLTDSVLKSLSTIKNRIDEYK